MIIITLSVALVLTLLILLYWGRSTSRRITPLSMRNLLRSKWSACFDANEVIDLPTIYINLERSPERRLYMTNEFESLRLNPHPTRLEAVDGAIYARQPWSEPWIHHLLHGLHINLVQNEETTAPELGCLLSHIKALIHVYHSRYHAALILEDDIDFSLVGLWGDSLSNLVLRTPPDWDFIQLYRGSDKCLGAKEKSAACPRFLYKKNCENCWGTVAYLVSKRAAERFYRAFVENGLLSEKYFWSSKGRDLQFTSDALLYNILYPSNVYLEELKRFVPYNQLKELESTVHPDHTTGHLERAHEEFQKYLDYLNSANFQTQHLTTCT